MRPGGQHGKQAAFCTQNGQRHHRYPGKGNDFLLVIEQHQGDKSHQINLHDLVPLRIIASGVVAHQPRKGHPQEEQQKDDDRRALER